MKRGIPTKAAIPAGSEPPDALMSMNNLAQTLYAQGDLAEARKLQEQVFEAVARLLGNEHPNTLTSMLNLAEIVQAEGDLAEADRLRRLARDSRGVRHVKTDDK
jgi:hypothetical protein